MPTPFNHLRAAQKLLKDVQVPVDCRALLNAESSAFLLGSISADARVNSGLRRADTHFYQYDQPMTEHPWHVMLERYPSLVRPTGAAHRVFVAGYVAHLAMDEWWTEDMLRAQFLARNWGPDERFRFFMLHILLVYMDERDYALLEDWQADSLYTSQPAGWLPFIGDDDLRGWRDFIAGQLVEGSLTLEVLGARVRRSPEEFRMVLDSPARMQADLWDHVPQETLYQVENQMYAFARDQMLAYLVESDGKHA